MAAAAQKRFEKERESILKELPESVTKMFGAIGFALPEDEDVAGMIPVLVVSPYDVPPKPVRDVYWWGLFGQSKKDKAIDKLAYLVYHYGHDDPDDSYSFVEQDEFLPYETGKERGYHILSEALAAKVEAGAELAELEQITVRGLKEMREDLEKDPLDRKRGVPFQERHEKLISNPPAKKIKT
mmetsp:Transcript_9331/g.12376  ORF Transcript_9331/g.12376 Transcript_9331/m.12376 type:complete len:183 (-) Transcript_9331:282-830(-)|eukprot:CAMPEP_0198137792 /NCGR_PEP_ID=MMETSP1443-20131203/1244_1 /TAXON_ID=186043 /ORGANISM="Entomoneis sp., Strain CCMP2396" /LENGTH=182 /DNA_ID=CAMNT_0043799339 /DNA_START=133 /DNA_END=681 /DNA_ORIENTATION=-